MALKLGKCRLCLKLGDFYSIFTVDNSVQLAEMVTECARIKVQEGDGLPDKICSECIQKLSSAFIFKQQCERSDQELRRNYVPPPGFKASPPSPNRQSSDSAFSNHTDISNKTKPSSSAGGYSTPGPRSRKRSRESMESVSTSNQKNTSSKRLLELKSSEKKPRMVQSETSQAESDFEEDYAPSQYSMDSDSDEPLALKFPCKLCPKQYDNNKSLAAHMKSHKNDRGIANKSLPLPSSTPKQDDAHDVENKLKCDKCSKTFKLQIMLKRHSEMCGKTPQTPTQKELLIALEPIDGVVSKKIECEYCSTRFKCTDNLEKHLRVVHAAVLKKDKVAGVIKTETKEIRSSFGVVTIPCLYCHKEFQDYYVYSAHFNSCPQKVDDIIFECPLCQKVMSKRQSYIVHVKRVHFDSFPPVGKSSKTPSKTNEVTEASEGKAPEFQGFGCRMCSKRLPTEQALITHLKGHLSSAEDEESRSSTIDDSASVHSEYSNSRVTAGNQYSCSQCDRRFKYKKALVTHELVAHLKKEGDESPAPAPTPRPPRPQRPAPAPAPASSEEDFDDDDDDDPPDDNTCDICEKQFSYRRLLLQHKRTKHNMSSGHKRAKITLKDCSVRCLICDVEMKVSAINQHNQTHIAANMKPRNIYTCAECSERFKSCSALAGHIKLVHRLKQAAPADLGGAELADFCEVVVTKAEPLDALQPHNGLSEVPPGSSIDATGFDCPVCTKRMKTILALKRHMNWHTVIGNNITKTIECFVCKETFRFKSHYRVHMSAHYKDPNVDPALLTCEICGRRSKHLRAAQAHMNYHKQTRFQTKDYRCSICKRVFEHRKVYLSHMAIHFKRGDSVSNIVVGSAPTSAEVAAAIEGAHTCHMCGKPCESETALKCHMAWHNSKTSLFGARHECPLCGLHFTNKKRCELHIRQHYESDDGPFKCTICGKGFIDEEFFKRHVKGHNFDHQSHKKRIEKLRKDKVKCPICTRYYPDMVKLIRHLRRTHPESKMIKQDPDAPPPKYFSCKLCAQVYCSERRLKNHEASHLRKPEILKCKFCFHSSYSMKQHNIHIKAHLTKKYIDEPLKCSECGQEYVKGYDLQHHLRDVHNIRETWIAKQGAEEPRGPLQEFQCSVCFKVLASRGNFERHVDFHNSLRCNYCFEYFNTPRFLDGHLEFSCEKRKLIGYTEVHQKKVKCHICYKAFHLQVKLDCHLRTQHDIKISKEMSKGKQELVCDYCFRLFENEDALIGHKVYHRTIGYYGCIYCNRKFNTLTLYRKHKNHHFSQLNVDNPTKCEHCDETFVAFREMIYHMRDVHNDDKEWVIMPKETIEEMCKICNKVFFNLHRHMSYHEQNRCKKCGEYFFSRMDFDNHLCTIESDDETLMNDDSDLRPKYEECNFCFKPITRTSSKSKHDQIHKSSGAISCRFCSHKFKTIDAFNIHAFSHRSRKYNKKPIVCQKCGEKFVRYGPFVKHLKNVHKSKKKMHYRAQVRAEPCVVCGDSFPNLHNHYRAHLANQCAQCRKYFTSYRLFSHHQCDKEDADPTKVFSSDADLQFLINTYVPKDENDDEKFYGIDGDDTPDLPTSKSSNRLHDDESQNSNDNSNMVEQSPVISDILSLYQIKKDEYESQDSQNVDDISQNGDDSQDGSILKSYLNKKNLTNHKKEVAEDDDVVHLSDEDVGMTDMIPVVITIDDD